MMSYTRVPYAHGGRASLLPAVTHPPQPAAGSPRGSALLVVRQSRGFSPCSLTFERLISIDLVLYGCFPRLLEFVALAVLRLPRAQAPPPLPHPRRQRRSHRRRHLPHTAHRLRHLGRTQRKSPRPQRPRLLATRSHRRCHHQRRHRTLPTSQRRRSQAHPILYVLFAELWLAHLRAVAEGPASLLAAALPSPPSTTKNQKARKHSSQSLSIPYFLLP